MSFPIGSSVWSGEDKEVRGGLHVNDELLRAFAQSEADVSSLVLQGSPVTDEGLSSLKSVGLLEELFLIEMGIGDAGVENLRYQPSLRRLGLNSCNAVTSNSFPVLGQLSKLEMLVLCDTAVSDEQCEHLDRLRELKALSLAHTSVTSACLPSVSRLRKLERIRLCGTNVDDTYLEQLAALPRLRRLRLNGTKVTSSGISSLKALPSLQSLELDDTMVDDDAVDAFCEFSDLHILSLSNSKVSTEGCLAIKERLGCAVSFP